MPESKYVSSDSVSLETRPRTPTEGRRRRPSSKKKPVLKPEERSEKSSVTGRGSKRGLKSKIAVRKEDKREDPNQMVTSASPHNLGAERDNKKRKGKATHALEASAPSKRPSRKSTRRGANHIKPDAQQRRQVTRAVRSPKSRHGMASG